MKGAPVEGGGLRAWLEYVAQTAIDMLDDLDRLSEDLEDDETEQERFL